MEVISAVIHRIEKSSGSQQSSLHFRESCLAINDELLHCLEQLLDNLNKKADKQFGRFQEEQPLPALQPLQQAWESADGLLTASKTLAEIANEAYQQSELLPGGFMLLVHYQQSGANYLLWCQLGVHKSFAVNDDMDLLSVEHLDLSSLQFGLKVNQQEWQRGNAQYYATAVKNRTYAKLGDALILATGFESAFDAKQDTQSLVKAVESYCESQEWEPEKKSEAKKKAFEYCSDQWQGGEPVELKELSGHLDHSDPDQFFTFASDRRFNLQPQVQLHRNSLRTLVKYSAYEKGLGINFEESLLDERVFVDEKNDRLIIEGIPRKLREQLMGMAELE